MSPLWQQACAAFVVLFAAVWLLRHALVRRRARTCDGCTQPAVRGGSRPGIRPAALRVLR